MAKSPRGPGDKTDLEKMMEHLKSPTERLEQHLEESSPSHVLKKLQEAADPAGAMVRRMEASLDPAGAALRRIEQGDPTTLAARLLSSGPVYGGALKDRREREVLPPPPAAPGSRNAPPSLLEEAQAEPALRANGDGTGAGGFRADGFDAGGASDDLRHAPEPVRQSVPMGSGIGGGVYSGPVVRDRSATIIQIRGLILAFGEAAEYDQSRHHNSQQPALWVDNPTYITEIKELIEELRRLNDLLEAGKEPTPAIADRIGKALTSGAEVMFKATCGVAGAGLGYIFLGSIIEVLSQLGLRNELNQILSWSSKLK